MTRMPCRSRRDRCHLAAVCAILAFAIGGAAQELPPQRSGASHVPTVRQVLATAGHCRLDSDLLIVASTESLMGPARVLRDELALLTGVVAETAVRAAPAASRSARPTIELQLDSRGVGSLDAAGLPAEDYELVVTEQGVVARSSTLVGVSWATSTLLQSLELPADGPAKVPCMTVRDAPSAPYRSLMVDVARSPHSIGVLEGVVRLARLYRIRFVHLHLTDDQHFTYPFEPVVGKLRGNAAYSRQALAGLVQYASDRGVTLVPEIDLPGHSSRLRESGYLRGAKTDADVASAAQWHALRVLVDDVIDMFAGSPYFHIGGDESGAGRELVPFLKRVNGHVRKRGKRLIVWEGFHGAPLRDLPATGEDRVLVASWESSYNAPWDLLKSGYELINASWCPLYVVGGDSRIHPGTSAGRKWSPAKIATWNKDRFMHWEPGRPVFEDRGPGDADRDDGVWDVVAKADRDKILGGQISVWEQRESSLLHDLRMRAPVLAERLWAGAGASVAELLATSKAVDARLWGLVQPVDISMPGAAAGPMERVAHLYAGDKLDVELQNRTRADGEIRWSMAPFRGDWNWIDFAAPESPSRTSRDNRLVVTGGAAIRAQLFDRSGKPVGSQTWARCLNWPMRVRVTEFGVGRRVPAPDPARGGTRIPDFDAMGPDAVTARYSLPMLRGPLDHAAVKGQRFEAVLVAPATGELAIGAKTQSGFAALWLDLDRDGAFSSSERLIRETPNSEVRQLAMVKLEKGRRYRLRVDHVTALPRPVLIVTLDQPDAQRPREISIYLEPLKR